jgi:hypothetical protein
MRPTNKEMQNNNPYVRARDLLLADLKKELVGPEADADILLIENPVTRYSAGVLFPSGYENKQSTKESEVVQEGSEKSPTLEGDSDQDNPADDMTAALANSFFPSVMAISFYCEGANPDLTAIIECATYKKAGVTDTYVKIPGLSVEALNAQEFADNFTYENGAVRPKRKIENAHSIENALKEKLDDSARHALHMLLRSQSEGAWIRTPHRVEFHIDSSSKRHQVVEGLDLVVVRKHIAEKSLTLFTVALENRNHSGGGLGEEASFFQTSLWIKGGSHGTMFTEYGTGGMLAADEEDANLAMLYRNKKTYAVGHGCAANWTVRNGKIEALFTDSVPTYEVSQASFEIEGLENANTLQMRFLAGIRGERNGILKALDDFCGLYESWIKSLETRKHSLLPEFARYAETNISLCKDAHKRMREGVKILESDSRAWQAFQLANRAMLMQAMHSDLQKTRRNPGIGEITWPDISDGVSTENRKWRPFQLAFLLLSIKGITEPASEDRSIIDLIWFSTGGGKTEAYLGLSAFTIFYERLQLHEFSGTTVMMRYTLRLLTAQQFQRACTLICAMEQVRRENEGLLGVEEISIGLWVGIASTPNTIQQAERQFEEFVGNPLAPCPSPVLSCPWCGTGMLIEQQGGRREYAMRKKNRPARVELYCKEPSCPFGGRDGRLPIKFVDEDIYNSPPTLLFGTVDKFAQMPRKEGVSAIFGLGRTTSPDLIIQDELHLISGALGTMVALYETAVDFLSSRSGRSPKIIASTATVRRAGEQCKNLFGRVARQFPTPGLEIEDSFFSREDLTRPGRLYVGVMPSGKTQTTASIRLTAKLLQSVYELPFHDDVKDKYSTLVCYFNSIRELGGFISLVNDDIKQYANDLRLRYGGYMRPIYEWKELTSRKRAEEIPQILEQLSVQYKTEDAGKKRYGERPIDILVATNMISVGVDIDRFGLMLVRGQPKMTSEYIQVSSRIGRRYPGLVVTLYNPARTRDRAHYERFITYHGSFYRNVEPSSITPFSLPARVRALNSVLVTMARHALREPGIGEERGVAVFKNNLPGVEEIKEFIMNRVRLVDPSEEAEVEKDIERAWQEWEAFIAGFTGTDKNPVYSNQKMGRSLLASTVKEKRPVGWIAPTSMRNVDAECNINIQDE